MYVQVKVPGSNRSRRVLAPSHVTPTMLANMGEKTQIQMFGGIAQQRPMPRSKSGRVKARNS